MNNINLFFLYDQESVETFIKTPKDYNYILYYLKKKTKITIINFSKTINENTNENKIKKILKKKNINYFCPSSLKDLSEILNKTKNNYAFLKAPFGFKYYKLLRTLRKSKIKLIQVSNYSFIFEKNAFEGRNIKQSIRIIFKMKSINYFHRVMSILGFYPKIHIHFDCDQNRIDLINNSLSKKFDRFFPLLKFSYYKKIIRINSRYYSDFIKLKKNKIENKYITLCDSPLAHEDFVLRDGPVNTKHVELYYKNLNLFLKKIEKIFKKKIIICLHPKGTYEKFKNFKILKKNFKVITFKTEYFISKSYLVLNTVSSTMNYAIMQNKPVVILKSKYYGNTVKGRIKNIQKELDYPIMNIDKINKHITKKSFFKKNFKKIDKFKYNRLFFKKNIFDYDQVYDYLKKNSQSI